MPVGASKQDELGRRRHIERHLFSIGMTLQDVAAALDIDSGSAKNDFEKLGGRTAFPLPDIGTAERRDWTFGNALKALHKLRRPSEEDDTARTEHVAALKRYVDYRKLLGIAEGLATAVNHLSNPADPAELRPYRKLLRDIFGEGRVELSGASLLDFYLEYVSIPGVNPPGRKDFSRAMGEWALSDYGENFRAVFDRSVANAFELAFARLGDEQYASVLRMRYGIGRPEATLEQVIEELGLEVGPERVRQIEAKALRRLRHPEQTMMLRLFTAPPEKVVHWLLSERYPDPPPPPQVHAPAPVVSLMLVLDTSVEELDMSIRSYKVLKNMGIKTVRDLVMRSEAEMLRSSNFGRKSLNELKEVLGNLGLSFGMQIGEDGLPVARQDENPAETL